MGSTGRPENRARCWQSSLRPRSPRRSHRPRTMSQSQAMSCETWKSPNASRSRLNKSFSRKSARIFRLTEPTTPRGAKQSLPLPNCLARRHSQSILLYYSFRNLKKPTANSGRGDSWRVEKRGFVIITVSISV